MASMTMNTLRLPLVLLFVHSLFGGLSIIARVALTGGMNVLIFNFYRSVIAVLVLVPVASCLERKHRPQDLFSNPRLLFRIFFLALVGLTASQSFFLVGMWLTSPSFGSTFQNVVPAFTFVVALAMGVEVVNFKRRDGWAKISGTLICILGAMTISMYKGPALLGFSGFVDGGSYALSDISQTQLLSETGEVFTHAMDFLRALGLSEWQVGTAILILGYIMWSLYLTLQVPVMEAYPAPLTITALTYFFAGLQFFVVAILTLERSTSTWGLSWGPPLLCVLYGGIMVSGVAYSLQTWCIQRGGPLLVAAFMPVQCVVVLLFSVIFLGEQFFLGSAIGGILIVIGLYLVLWGRAQAQKLRRVVESLDLEKALRGTQSLSSDLTTPFLPTDEVADTPAEQEGK